MTQAIFFDFWGTLIENGVFPSPVRQTRFIMGIRLPFHEYIVRFEKAFMTKPFETMEDAFTAVFEEFGVADSKDKMEKLIGLWNKNFLMAKPFPETMETLEKVKGKYKLILISNTDPFQIQKALEKFQLKEYFDEIVLSCEVGKLKTDPTIFTDVLKKLKIKPKDALMVGDSIETDMKGAEKAGMQSVLVDRRDKRDYPNKVLTLDQIDTYLED